MCIIKSVAMHYCLSHFKCLLNVCVLSDTHVRMLEDCVLETIQEQNKLAAGSDRCVYCISLPLLYPDMLT